MTRHGRRSSSARTAITRPQLLVLLLVALALLLLLLRLAEFAGRRVPHHQMHALSASAADLPPSFNRGRATAAEGSIC